MIRVAVIGAGGYSGAELIGLLAGHEAVEIAGLFASDSGGAARRFDEVFPRFRGVVDLPLEPTSIERVLAAAPQAVFLATPPQVSHDLAPALIEGGAVVLDLSAAFRLPHAPLYAEHYGFEHGHQDLLDTAVYGLPELHHAALRDASLVALPGCYPTSIVLPLAALAAAGVIDGQRPVIADSTSGVSGAGRGLSLESMFCEVSQQPYRVLCHRHGPEIDFHSGTRVIFTPHLGPYERGIVSTIHADLAAGCTEDDARAALSAAYAHEPFVRLLPPGRWPSAGAVRGTNFCDVALAAHDSYRHLIVVSAIDNLLKGAAGQALQCFNIRFGLPLVCGLPGARRFDHEPSCALAAQGD